MPELPEVEHLRRSLAPHVTGARIERAALLRRDVLHPGDLRSLAALEERVVIGVERRGKQLMLVTDGPALVVQLGMTGMLRIAERGAIALPHLHARATLRQDGPQRRIVELRFHDARRFGSLTLYRSRTRVLTQHWGALGPDAMTLTPEVLAQRLAGRGTAIKAALLDQALVAGIGNIYADEALHRAGIHPCRPAGRLRLEEFSRLAEACLAILSGAIEAGGSTIRDYVDACGLTGEFTREHAVYGRAGEPCLKCGTVLSRTTVAGRTTVWCPTCQPRRPTARGDHAGPDTELHQSRTRQRAESGARAAHRAQSGCDRRPREARYGTAPEPHAPACEIGHSGGPSSPVRL